MNKQTKLPELIYQSILTMETKELVDFILKRVEDDNCSYNRFKELLQLQFIGSGNELSETKLEVLNRRLDLVFECEIKDSERYKSIKNVQSFFNQFELTF
jgi:hypothetical protein